MNNFTSFMPIAIIEAKKAASRGEVPVGALIEINGEIISSAGNRTRELKDPTAHAEILVIRNACSILGVERLIGANLYVTLEPCPMCAAAISNARIANLYFGARDIKSGGINQGPCIFNHPQSHHKPEIYDGISELECRKLLLDFFKHKRN
ncbi:nucleoside deaminase [Amylibacter sp.]|jgi:tRNA(adenine34) deaminase|nr:nucleoside deaminase [Rhodobacterales bacterium]MCO4796170.1 nucleoside deaminase [Amylibacter sp.]MBT4323638.1 nucleoside deaminase [Rhodobacterales bacterium]MBT6009349.1 nucleoside deaminase [Rhodobacterales bacterium]MBT6833023.1 nucleoside deaminase [Rhodobacterales bacterium]|tara:strand:+ start:460 stop:912 length:453 start_codon:yes stop_codon:yes gene_type:complete